MPRFSQEWIEGRTLVDAIAHHGPGSLPGFAAEAMRTLGFVHGFDLTHRDIKPDNLLVREHPKLGYRLAIVDFGLATRPAAEPVETLQLRGTLPYLAPELFDNHPAGPKSDLYALGSVLYEAIHGHPPYVPDPAHLERFIEASRAGRRSRPPLPDGHPPGLAAWIEAMLAPEPANRPGSAAEALDRLNAACGTDHPLDTAADRAARLLSGPPAGRDRQLAALRKQLGDPDGAGLVFLSGEAGSGKSRLLRWLYTEAVQQGWYAEFGAVTGETPGTRRLLLIEDGAALGDTQARELERLPWAKDRSLRAVVAVDPNAGTHPRLETWLRRASSAPGVCRLDLERLDNDSLRDMAERAYGGPVAAPTLKRLAEESGGRPAAVEAALIGEAPDGLEGGRVSLLSEDARRWIEALAVLGRDARAENIDRIAGLTPAAGRLAAQETLCMGIAWRHAGGWRLTESQRTKLLRDMGAGRKRELHIAALGTIDDDTTSTFERIRAARLRHHAGRTAEAVEGAAAAAHELEIAGDLAAAAVQWGRALSYLGRGREGRADLRLRQAESHLRAGQAFAAVRAFSAAGKWSTDPAARLHAAARRALARVRAGQFETALAEAERIAQRALAAGKLEELALARQVCGIALARTGREERALPMLDDARDMLERLGDRAGQATIVHARANCLLRLGRDYAETDFREALRLWAEAREAGHADEAAELRTRIGLAVVQTRAGRLDEAEVNLARAGREAASLGLLDLQQDTLSRRAVVALERGAFDRAIELAGEAAELSRHLGDLDRLLVNRCHGADARIRCGLAADAVTELRGLLDGPLDRAEPRNVDYARMVLADAMMRSDRGEDAAIRDLLDGCRRRARRRGAMRPHLFSLVLELERRARPECPDAFSAAWREYEIVVADSGEPAETEIAARAQLARAAWSFGRSRYEITVSAARATLDLEVGAGNRVFHARACAWLGQALDRLGRDDEAREVLDRGRKLVESILEGIEDDALRRSFSSQAIWAPLSEESFLTSRDNHARLLALYDMLRILNSSTDPDTLLESILDLALGALRAERGMILLKQPHDREEDAFAVHLARNLDADTMEDVRSYSRRIVAAAAKGESLLALDAGTDERFQDYKSVSLYGIRSLICVPLRSRERIIGTVYLDSRRDGMLFTQDDLRFLEAFADQAALALGNVLERVELEDRNRQLQALAETRTRYDNLIGRCAAMQRVFDTLDKFSATNLPVLIHGESGTGKEIVARAIHFNGPRRKRSFVSENCAALPETLLESELFGHVRGAFTGAERDHPGLFEQAHKGTLFLDEIGDMSAAMQARLLRVLEEGEIRRVGGERSIEVDVRVLAATHRDLGAEVQAGRFREDLFYRLQVLTVSLPALRDRPGDVPLLCDHFLRRIGEERGLGPLRLAPDVLALLHRHEWPGNVRQLENTLQRLVVLADGRTIDAGVVATDPDLRTRLGYSAPRGDTGAPFSLEAGEKTQLEKALQAAGGNRSAAARLLNVSRATFYRKLRRHGL
jgi:Nif-specific regulatory protein